MKIDKIILKNFRAYDDETICNIENLCVFVGKNDVGKSTVLEALDIFFNGKSATNKLCADDINVRGKKRGVFDIEIGIIFSELPNEIIIDSSYKTNLADEHLLLSDNRLHVIKRYTSTGREKVFIYANHPTNPKCSELLLKSNTALKKILKENNIESENDSINSKIRKAIWNKYSGNLELNDIEIDVTKEGAKKIWEQLVNYMPTYFLFQSDRSNSDGDNEVQDPIKYAVKEILKNPEIKESLTEVAKTVIERLREVTDNTLNKLKDMNEEIASTLSPNIPEQDKLKWEDVFKQVSINSDDDIPINKRGSGVKRLILLNFFRAEVERRKQDECLTGIIYGIEEPETSQHPGHQKMLIEALKELSEACNTQVFLTTHSPQIVKMLDYKNLKLITSNTEKCIDNIEKIKLPFTSLNAVNYFAFGEATEEYHNELFGFIEIEKKDKKFQEGKSERKYIDCRFPEKDIRHTLTVYIRHQIHHPENKLNEPFTPEELHDSINMMEEFIKENML